MIKTDDRATWKCAEVDCGEVYIKSFPNESVDDWLLRIRDHWKTCKSPRNKARQRRAWLDPNVIPISHSGISTWKECPREFYFGKIAQLGRVSGAAADEGTTIHEELQALAEGKIEDISHIPSLADVDDVEDLRLRAKRMFKVIFEDLGFTPESIQTETTKHYNIPLPDGRTCEIEIRIDLEQINRETETIDILDYKSGRWLVRNLNDDVQGREDQRDVAQGKLYSWITIRIESEKEGIDFWQATFHQGQVRAGEILSRTFTLEELENFGRAFMRNVVALSVDEEFAPTPGKHCFLCPYSHRCDAGQRYLGEKIALVDKDGQKVVEFLAKITNDSEYAGAVSAAMQLKAVSEVVLEAAREYAKSHDPVVIGSGKHGYYKKESQRISNVVRAFHVAESLGLPVEALFKFDHRAGGTYINENGRKKVPELQALLQTETKFEWDFLPMTDKRRVE